MKRILIAIILLAFPAIAYATQVSGDVWGVWDSTMNPIQVVGELRVPPDSSLIIGPGCYIEFQGHYMFVVDTSAVLQAEGTETDSVFFTSDYPSTLWYGIKFFNAGDSCSFFYCVLEYGYAHSNYPIYDYELQGGAIYSEYTDLKLKNCILRYNRAPEGQGGGVFIVNGDITIDSCEIIDNYCGFEGSGLCARSGNVVIINSLFERDTTWYIFGGEIAGALGCRQSPYVYLFNNRFEDNFSGMIGNVIMADTANVILNVFKNNHARSAGGGLIVNVDSSAFISQNLFTGNGILWPGPGGGGLTVVGSGIVIANNTIINNSSTTYGGGIKCANDDTNFAVNNIIWNNTAQNGPQIYIEEGTMIFTYCDVEGGWQGVGNIDIDPLFRDTANGDFHLMSAFCGDPYDSPCIDVGDPTIQDYLLDCDWGLGDLTSDMGAYGGGDSLIAGISENPIIKPNAFMWLQNYPNPFNSSTNLEFYLSANAEIELSIYNLLGQKIATLYNGRISSGGQKITWQASGLPSAIYFAKLMVKDKSFTRKMVYLK